MHALILIDPEQKKKQPFRWSQTKDSIHTHGKKDISFEVISNARTEKPF